MGCDIHMFIEWREEGEDKWQLDRHHIMREEWGDIYMKEITATGRWYHLFGMLADQLRYHTNFRWKLRDLPKDISTKLKEYIEDDPNLHSHSWLTPRELKETLNRVVIEQEREYRWYASRSKTLVSREDFGIFNPLNYEGEATTCFYDWETVERKDRPTDWVSILDYIKLEQDKHNAEQILLKPNNPTKLEARLVFCFDN